MSQTKSNLKPSFWLDIEKKVFLAFFDFYFWWFFPKRLHKAIRTTGNLLLGIHMLSVGVLGGVLVRHILLQSTTPIFSNGVITDQIIRNTGRLDRLEEQERSDIQLAAEILRQTNELKLQVGLLQQELTLYRWAFGLIFVVLVGQLGVAVFSVLMRREVERRELPLDRYGYQHDHENHEDK
jgi:hypothetical protein